MRRLFARIGSILLVTAMVAGVIGAPLAGIPRVSAETTPSYLLYEGRVLDGDGNPVTSAVVLRFSFWKSADWVSGDTTGAGAINTSAAQYGGWYEVQTVTPSSNGIVSIQLGSSTSLPTLDFAQHKYLQVEIKTVGAADTSYVVLDPTGDNTADTIDRKFIGSVAYAENAESVGNRTVGTSSGNIVILGPDGRVTTAQMGSGTNVQTFTINATYASGDVTLRFGNSLLPETIKFSQTHAQFEFSDDINVQGNLTMSGSLNASGAIIAEGNITINDDNSAADAVLTFGNNLARQTLKYSATNQRFEFSKDVYIAGDLTLTGAVNGVEMSVISVTPLQVTASTGLSIDVASGSYRLGNTIVNFGGSSGVAVSASATNYVFFGSGGLTVRTMTFPSDESFIPLAVVTTSSSAVTNVTDRRVLQSDTREADVTDMLTAEFDKATYQADASSNVGMLSMSQDNITKRNYYLWSSTMSSLQDYDIFVRYQLPQTFVRWKQDGSTNSLAVQYRSTSATSADNALDIAVYDTNGSPVSLSGSTTNLASTSWSTTEIEFLGNPTWTAGQEMLFKFHMSAKNSKQIHLGSVQMEYTTLQGQ